MSEDMDAVLRNSLDAVDRGRRWAMLGVIALFVATAIALAALFGAAATSRVPSPNLAVLKVLYVASAAEMLFTACCAVVVMFHVTRMTKAVLRRFDVSKDR
jgi:hypothetical protein